jgi:hypothetical protein
MAVALVVGVLISTAAPLLRRHRGTAATALAAGAGEAAIQESRRFAMTLGCEVPVSALALISLSHRTKLFWAGWIIHALLTLWLIVVVVWLKFFWHW